ncbi:hypothetical protein [Allobaculum sp. Allo2]|uniref:hypothetical protein n=1 Tax=Allobaculum sp. Allo2 TaxID=2853432 RepID=UPI001F6121E3|nr:hypothetical protein [Allobaculum sp. Allo2]UNT92379.1 hypothetical protein KWG61_09310 [Allobaculum sp. Allo2]
MQGDIPGTFWSVRIGLGRIAASAVHRLENKVKGGFQIGWIVGAHIILIGRARPEVFGIQGGVRKVRRNRLHEAVCIFLAIDQRNVDIGISTRKMPIE